MKHSDLLANILI